jgi:hypothetical protein
MERHTSIWLHTLTELQIFSSRAFITPQQCTLSFILCTTMNNFKHHIQCVLWGWCNTSLYGSCNNKLQHFNVQSCHIFNASSFGIHHVAIVQVSVRRKVGELRCMSQGVIDTSCCLIRRGHAIQNNDLRKRGRARYEVSHVLLHLLTTLGGGSWLLRSNVTFNDATYCHTSGDLPTDCCGNF